ncbi:hypothetical protein DEJ51_07510 [Streptomyces venezuelae]|uniref:Uncharacterized protein n=1 Tax=Streptomyces venezuelae TaxID=54571 RepID=A0A5P2DG82_STRVZ|nr:hypothetical protein [Streptomyces venezuelae]QES54106.1 hypothetical protein DEJ51_07510 [Streptomyces venezuelae]
MNTRETQRCDLTEVKRPSPSLPGSGRRILRAVALTATVPYLGLKAAWLCGSRLGIPEGSVLREPGPFFTAANAVTLAMDACVILLVLVLTRPWGIRVPGPLLTVPVFVATGLLTPILFGFTGQLLLRAFGFGADPMGQAAREPFLDPWVFHVVYTGFSIQGLALAALFVPYARERWGWAWRGVTGERLPSSTGVVAAAAASAGLVVAGVSLYWAAGGSAGLTAERAAARSCDMAVVSAVHAMCALAAGAGALLLTRGGRLRARWPLGLAWVGGAATLSWGAWTMLAALGPQLDGGEAPPATTVLIYACQMITGLLTGTVLIRFLTTRRPG